MNPELMGVNLSMTTSPKSKAVIYRRCAECARIGWSETADVNCKSPICDGVSIYNYVLPLEIL